MNKRIRLLSVIIALMMLLTGFSMTVYAIDEITDPNAGVVDPVPDPQPEPEPAPPTTAPEEPVTPTTAPDDPSSGEVVDPTVAPDDGTVDDPSSGYVDDGNDDFYYYDEDEMANSIESSAGSVSDMTDLYDTSGINEKALEKEEWNDIVLDTSTKSDVTDFSAIKENTNKDDDGKWILYTGFILIGLSVIGIMYFIIATATYKKKLKKLKARQHQHDSNRTRARDDYGDYGDYPTQRDYNKRYQPQRKRYASDGMSYAERKRLTKADTADIDLPAKYRARH
ncbi:MAG: hypothetical protein IJO20_05730 [Ruminococcus sp.]|nr:hypothetical protein [Ruminococcus sp.]MBQ7133979.1 hypothetical protein [Ruminococcus sp.]